MKLIETKGAVRFYEDEKGVQFQQIGDREPIKVYDGEIKYKHLKSIGDYSIQYNLNGVYGFAIIAKKTEAVLETGYWDIDEAIQAAKSFGSYS